MDTVTSPAAARPSHGSVESFAEMIREYNFVRTCGDVYVYATGIVASVAKNPLSTDAQKVEQVRNALAAAELVRDEIRASTR